MGNLVRNSSLLLLDCSVKDCVEKQRIVDEVGPTDKLV